MIHQTSMAARRPIQSQPITRQLAGSGACADGVSPCSDIADDIAKVTSAVAPIVGSLMTGLI